MTKRVLASVLSFFLILSSFSTVSFALINFNNSNAYKVIMLKSKLLENGAVQLSWTKAKSSTKYVVYGRKGGEKIKKKIATVRKNSYIINNIKELKSNSKWKFCVDAYKGNKKIGKSPSIIVYTNKKINKQFEVKNMRVNGIYSLLREGEQEQLTVTVRYNSKKTVKNQYKNLRFVSADKSIAKVSDKGLVTALAPYGETTIYVQHIIGGKWSKIRVVIDIICYKPIIYLYPETKTKINVKLGKPNDLTVTYPYYSSKDGWNVIANPDGKLIDTRTGREQYALYWEGIGSYKKMEDGFVVAGKDTVSFLEEKLKILGLTDREADEFIVYWLPKLQENKFNLIRFATLEEINENMPLDITPNPDTLIRVMMVAQPLENKINIKEQKLSPVYRSGYTAVEWGGTIIK